MKKMYYFLVGTIILLFANAYIGYAEENSLARFEAEDWYVDVVGCELKTSDQLYVLLSFMNTGDESQSPDIVVSLVGYQNGIEINKNYSSQGPEGYYAKDTKVQPGYTLPYFEIVEINGHSPVTIELEPYWNWNSKPISYTFSTEEIEGLVSGHEDSSDIETTMFVPGTYSASSKGIESDVVVTATFDETRLTDLDIDVSGETPGIGADIGARMKQAFLEAQSPDVDGVSGASVTSEALISAMKDVFAQAENGEQAEADNIVLDEELSPGEAADKINKYLPGTYTASAPGIESDVKVEATFNETMLTDLRVDVSGETPGIGAEIGDLMTKAFLEAQSPDVDGVSGASVTSGALKEAMAEVFKEAADLNSNTGESQVKNFSFHPGAYKATAYGIESDVTVRAQFSETELIDVDIDVSNESVGSMYEEDFETSLLEKQIPDIDQIAGATITSDAVIKAMEYIYEEATNGEYKVPVTSANEKIEVYYCREVSQENSIYMILDLMEQVEKLEKRVEVLEKGSLEG